MRKNVGLCNKGPAIIPEYLMWTNLLKKIEFWSPNINNDQITLLLYCCDDLNSHCSEGDPVPFCHVFKRGRAIGSKGSR